MKHLVLALLLGMTACQRPQAASLSESKLTPEKRSELSLPPAEQLTLATQSDMDNAKTLPKELLDSVSAFLKSQKRPYVIVAARPVGNHLLLWISFPYVDDGGVDLIYSVKDQKIVGEFKGGIRG